MDILACQARVNQHREHRFSADVRAMLHWDGISQPVTIQNISIYGALIAGAWLPNIGDRVTLIAAGLEVLATAIWKGPDRCGLLLNHAIDPLAVIAQSRVHETDQPLAMPHIVGPAGYA